MEQRMQIMAQTMERSAGTIPALRPIPTRDPLDLLEQFGVTISVPRDREIHGQGDQAAWCYRVISGCVRVVNLMEDGRRQISEFLMPGDTLGFDAFETYDFAAEAVSNVVLRRYPRRMVDALVERNIALAGRIRDVISTSLRMAHAQLVLLGRKTASERIATFLLEMVERLPQARANVLDLPMSRTDMADHLGLTIETVCRVLAHLRREGTISINRASIAISNVIALQQMASEARH
jgi:CRP/FNR family transcriptional regulator, nitrogen fixation regulation protein